MTIASLAFIAGWSLSLLAWFWIILILVGTLTGRLSTAGGSGSVAVFIAEAPVNWLRRLVPTVYRSMDVAPWLTILLLILMKTFVFRALLVWGLLHGPA